MNGHVRKRGNKYTVVLFLGYDDVGKKKYKWIGGFTTKREAQRVLAEKLHDLHRGLLVDQSTQPLGEFIRNWLKDKEAQVRPSTFYGYNWLVKRHLIPHLGHVRLCDLKPRHLQEFYSKLLNTESPLSKRSVLHLHYIIRDALNRAVRWELVAKNVADFVDPPSPETKQMSVWTAEQVRTFLAAAKANRYYIAFLLAICTGMRKGEILGLKWEDVDLDNGRIYVRRSLHWRTGGHTFTETKTSNSRRMIPLPPSGTEALRTYKQSQDLEKCGLGSLYDDHGLVITGVGGGPAYPRTVDEQWYRCRNAADVPKIRFHDLRHTHATLLLQQGVHPKIVSERLGHSDVTITLNIYSHVLPGMQEQVAKDFDVTVFLNIEL